MKSTIKIDYERRNEGGQPVIKIIQPVEAIETDNNETSDDVRDKLLRDFLKTPCMVDRNYLFELNSHFSHPAENPNLNICTISPIPYDNILRTFRNILLNRFIPYNALELFYREKHSDEKSNEYTEHYTLWSKINKFFDELDKINITPQD